jgi:hypothetical protein
MHIPINDALPVQALQRHEQLSRVETASFLRESAKVAHVEKQLTAVDVFLEKSKICRQSGQSFFFFGWVQKGEVLLLTKTR